MADKTIKHFDDFVFKGAVADTQSKVNECNNMLTYGYGKGYLYAQDGLYVFLPTERGYLTNNEGYFSPFFSLILKSSFAKTLPLIGINGLSHAKMITHLKGIFKNQCS